MRLALVLMLLLPIVGSWFVTAPAPTHACSCDKHANPQEAYEAADHVFRASAVKAREGFPLYSTLFTFKVDTVWKGQFTDRMDLWTYNDGATCGRPLPLNELHIFYLQSDRGAPYAFGYCDRIVRGNSSEDLAFLGEGFTPKPISSFDDDVNDEGSIADESITHDEGMVPPRSNSRWLIFAGIGVFGAMVASTAMLRLLTRRRPIL